MCERINQPCKNMSFDIFCMKKKHIFAPIFHIKDAWLTLLSCLTYKAGTIKI